MRVTKKGHELDEVYKRIIEIDEFFLYGAGMYGQLFYKCFSKRLNIAGFIDKDTKKQNTGWCGLPVYDIDEYSHLEKSKTGIIMTLNRFNDELIQKKLRENDLKYNVDLFMMETVAIAYSVYKEGEIIVPHLSFLPSTACNLNCEACLNFNPFAKRVRVRSFEELKIDIDTLFKYVSHVMFFHISGGEVMLYKQLPELIDYIGENYRDRITGLGMTTNGTILPSDDVLKSAKKHRMIIKVDDYRDSLKNTEEVFQNVCKKIEDYDISYFINKVDAWLDLKPMETDYSNWDEERLSQHFEECRIPVRDYRDGKVYVCAYSGFADTADICEAAPEDYFELDKLATGNIKELAEFWLGYTEKGYTEFCKQCRGFANWNKEYVQPAKQCIMEVERQNN